MKTNFFVSLLIFLSGCQTSPFICDVNHPHPKVCQPPRAEVMIMDAELDQTKPVASEGQGSWVMASDLLIGSIGDGWIGATSLKDRSLKWWHPVSSPVAAPTGQFGTWTVVGLRDGRVLKMESQSGKIIWEKRSSKFISRPFVLFNQTLFAVSIKQELIALDFRTGKAKWIYDPRVSTELIVKGAAPPVINGSRVFFTVSTGELHAVNLKTGRLIWKAKPGSSRGQGQGRFRDAMGQLFVENNRLVMARNDGMIFGLNLGQKGDVNWKHQVSAATSAVVSGGTLFVGCLNGDVYSFDATSGRQRWKVSVGRQAVAHIHVGKQRLFLAGSKGRIAVISVAKGELVWHDDLGGMIPGPPLVFNDRIYFATGLKALYSYRI